MKLSLPAALLLGSSLVNALPTAENLHQLRSGTADPKAVKRCPFADIPDSVNEHGVDKRLLLSSLNTPVDGMYAAYSEVLLTARRRVARTGPNVDIAELTIWRSFWRACLSAAELRGRRPAWSLPGFERSGEP